MPIILTMPPPPDDADFSFRSKCNYMAALLLAVRARHGATWFDSARSEVLQPMKKFAGRPRVPLTGEIEKALRNGWNTEVLLGLPRDELIQSANHWAPIQAYYSTFHMARSLLLAENQNPTTHRGYLDIVADRVANSSRFPYPLNTACVSFIPRPSVVGLSEGFEWDSDFQAIRLPSTYSCEQYVFSSLKTTREYLLGEQRLKWLKENKRQRISAEARAAHDRGLKATTIFDLLYRFRVLANYGDADVFVSGGLADHDPYRFFNSLVETVAFINFVFEVMLVARLGIDSMMEASAGVHASADPDFALSRRRENWVA